MSKIFTVIFLLAFFTVARAQTAAPSDVQAKLSLAENKTVYRIGEPIKLVMEFTADREGYTVEYSPDDKDGIADTLVISPDSGIVNWLDDLAEGRGMRCIVMSNKVSRVPPDPRAVEIRDAYVMELAASLNKRTGDNQTRTAITLLLNLDKDSQTTSEQLREVRRILVQQFDTMHHFDQEWLLKGYWELLRDPALIPSLKKMLKATGPAARNLHEVALLRLKDLAPDELRPCVVAEIIDTGSFVDAKVLGGVKDESLRRLTPFVGSDSHAGIVVRESRALLIAHESALVGSVRNGKDLSAADGIVPGPKRKLVGRSACWTAGLFCEAQ